MNLLEHQGKFLLQDFGLTVPQGELVESPEAAAHVAGRLGGRVVCKAQVPAGKRGKAGAVQLVDTPDEARAVAGRLLGSEVGGYVVTALLVEEAVDIARELYAAVLDDPASKGPLVLFSTAGGMDIEEVNAQTPELVHQLPVDPLEGLSKQALRELLAGTDLDEPVVDAVSEALQGVFAAYKDADANLVEVNPMVVTSGSGVVALDAKVTIDAGSVPRQQERIDALPGGAQVEAGTELEQRGREQGFHFIELDGDVGVLANGAGLTMTTLDAINHFGGRPANFLEIGGESYTRATPALGLVLDNPRVKSLLVNFCGAFARTDVMTEGVVNAIEELRPDLPIAFTIHGTGEDEAIAMVRDRLGIEPYDLMDDAVQAAVSAARGATEEAAR
ncbi:MAG: succinate--CoA ligase subunit beta [Nocardioidaceae bacterium]